MGDRADARVRKLYRLGVPGPLAVLFAIVVAITEVLPLAGRAHGEVLGLLLDVTIEAPFRGIAHIAAALALLVFARRRIALALSDGLSALVRPGEAKETRGAREAFGLGIATAVGIPLGLFLRHAARGIADAPIAVGIGLLATGAMLMSTSAALRSEGDALTARRAVIVGLCQGFASLPGGSVMAAGVAALLWSGLRARRASETAAILAIPHEIALASFALSEPSAVSRVVERPGVLVAASIGAVVAGLLAGGRLIRVTERRMVSMGGYLAVLGAGSLAYGWALH